MFFKFFKRKRQKEYQALLKSSAAFVRIETLDDSDEYIEIVFPPLSDDEINRLQFLLDKGVKISSEDLDFIKKALMSIYKSFIMSQICGRVRIILLMRI